MLAGVFGHTGPAFGALGLGYGVNPWVGSHGPQVTFSLLPFYVRLAYRFGEGVEAYFGLMLKLPVAEADVDE